MSAPTTTRIDRCRACGSAELEDLFSLGDQFVSGFRLPDDPPLQRAPIGLVYCRGCTLTQQRYTVPSELLYARHYWYRSGTTDTMRAALADVVRAASARVTLRPGDVVLDIGSNDGTLLRQYPSHLCRVGVEPATNLTTLENYESQGLLCVRDFWRAETLIEDRQWFITARTEAGLRAVSEAKIITALGMLYDLDDPLSFLRDVARVLAPDGVFVAQLQCLAQTVRLKDVGNLCHEHLEFYTLRALGSLMLRAGLYVEDVEENDVNGGSYRLYCRKRPDHPGRIVPKGMENPAGLERLIDATSAEDAAGLTDPARLRAFGDDLLANAMELRALVETLVRGGKTVWAYGASTKGNVILQSAGLGPDLVRAAADRSPEKWGRLTCTGVPVVSEDEFRKARPAYAVMLPYTFFDEFDARESAWRAGGGRWVLPVPKVEVR